MNRVHSVVVCLATLPLLGCGLRAQPTPGGEATHQVRYTVNCEHCRVAYTISGGRMQQVEMKGLWTQNVPLRTSAAGPVSLTATPLSSGAIVSRATIEVDGKKVAEERRRTRATFGDEVTLMARLPGAGRWVGN